MGAAIGDVAAQRVGRREGGKPRGFVVNGAFAAEFAKGPVTIAATSFLRYGDRAVVTMPPVPRGLLAVWVEEMKIPTIDGAALHRSATLIPMLSAAWQEKQDPENRELQTADDRFHYDGTFTANAKLIGNWTAVDVVPAIDSFVPVDANPVDAAAKKAASADANKRAEEFAKTGHAKVGVMRSASQGSFNILDAHNPDTDDSDYGGTYDKDGVDKLVRLVVTIDYAIEQ